MSHERELKACRGKFSLTNIESLQPECSCEITQIAWNMDDAKIRNIKKVRHIEPNSEATGFVFH